MNKKKKKRERHIKIIDNIVKLPDKEGNGILRYSVNTDKDGKMTRYSVAYINFHLSNTDNGRILGYDNCHGYHHKHYLGKEEMVDFINYDNILKVFEKEWRLLHEKNKKQTKY